MAILAALLAPVLAVNGNNHFDLFKIEFWIAAPIFLFSVWTRSLGGTVLAGMFLYWLSGKVAIF